MSFEIMLEDFVLAKVFLSIFLGWGEEKETESDRTESNLFQFEEIKSNRKSFKTFLWSSCSVGKSRKKS